MKKNDMEFMVSVIVPTYNNSDTIEEALDSIFNQTYEKLELIITDDNSTDTTVKVVQNWLSINSDRFLNAVVLENDINQGVVKNLNKAIKKAKGDYLKFTAGDDILLPEAVRVSMDCLSLYPQKINFYKVRIFGPNLQLNRNMQRFCDRGYRILNSSQEKMYRELLKDNYIAGPSWGVIPKKVFDNVGMFDERFPMLEDYPFLVKLKQNRYEFLLIESIQAKYRISGDSLCHSEGLFKESLISFCLKEKVKLLLQEKMYYAVMTEKMVAFRYKLKKQYGSKSLFYIWSYFLYLFMPVPLIKAIRNRIG